MAISFPLFSEQEYWFMRSWQSNSEEHGLLAHSSISVKEAFSHIKDIEFDVKRVKSNINFIYAHNRVMFVSFQK